MELLSSDLYFILVDGDKSLWVNRKTGTFSAKIHGMLFDFMHYDDFGSLRPGLWLYSVCMCVCASVSKNCCYRCVKNRIK